MPNAHCAMQVQPIICHAPWEAAEKQHTHVHVTTRHGVAVHEIAQILKEHSNLTVMEDVEGHNRTPTQTTWLITQIKTLSKPDILPATLEGSPT